MTTDDQKREVLRDVAADLRDEGEKGERIAALVHRVSDLYDDDEETDPEHVYRNMKNILQISEQGGMNR